MRRIALLALIAAPLAGFSAPAFAGCTFPTFQYFPEKNDGVVVGAVVRADTSCRHSFAEGPGYRFTGLSVAGAPEHGTLRRRGDAFVYTPDKGFRGKDAYMVKVCATKGAAKGCSGVGYVSTVE